MHQEILFPHEKTALYPLLAQQIAALAEDSQPLSTLANASALLYEALPDINWAGFYLASGDMLHLGPFQGRTACTQIPFGRGVCGTAAATRQVQVVPDVERFRGISPVTARPGRKSFCQFGWTGASSVCWTLIRQA